MAEDRSIKIVSGSLHESPFNAEAIILRGVIDPESLRRLKVDDYQREVLPLGKLHKMMNAVREGGSLPDIEIGMRGDRVRNSPDGNTYFLQDECFIIDGQQRVNACMNVLTQNGNLPLALGAAIHFNTTKEWEKERFRVLNTDRAKVSPNVLARNLRDQHHMLDQLYTLTEMPGFVLSDRVSWSQGMKRNELITALNFLKVCAHLHGHISPGHATRLEDVAIQLDNMAERATPSQIRENVVTFFNAIDEMWGIRTVQYRELSAHLKGGFLQMLATFLSDHEDFWRGVRGWKLFIDVDLKRKIASFGLTDPHVAALCSSAGASRKILYGLLLEHVNSGKRFKQLKRRKNAEDRVTEDEGE